MATEHHVQRHNQQEHAEDPPERVGMNARQG
jgi:hypothetical protein